MNAFLASTARLLFCCSLLGMTSSPGRAEDPKDADQKAYTEDNRRFWAALRSREPRVIESVAEEIFQKWRKVKTEKPNYYALIALEIVGQLGSPTAGDSDEFADRRESLARHYAMTTLQNADRIPLWIEVELVQRVRRGFLLKRTAPRGPEWLKQRTAELIYWFHACKRLHAAIDPTWVPDERGLPIHAPVPAGVQDAIIGGMSPKSIKDPKLRAQYERNIKEHSAKIQRNSEQRQARELAESFFPTAEKYIIEAYSHSPVNMSELDTRLKDYIADEEMRTRILEAVWMKTGGMDPP